MPKVTISIPEEIAVIVRQMYSGSSLGESIKQLILDVVNSSRLQSILESNNQSSNESIPQSNKQKKIRFVEEPLYKTKDMKPLFHYVKKN